MSNQINFPDKNTDDKFYAAEANEIKDAVNANGTLLDGAITTVGNKVDKVTGKQLSTEDYTTAEKGKLSGIATGATANDTDANLKNRANHTGTQAASTIVEDSTHRFWTDAEKAANTAAIVAITPTIQPETAAYIQRIIAAGSSINSTAINAIDEFVVEGKNSGWFSLIKMFAPMLGSSLAGALVKFKVDSGGATSMINNGMVEADYSQRVGFTVVNAALNKFIDSGVVPSDEGLSGSDMCFGYVIPNNVVAGQTNGYLIGSSVDSTNSLWASGDGGLGGGMFKLTDSGNAGRTVSLMTEKDTLFASYRNGATSLHVTNYTPNAITQNTSVLFFKSNRGSVYYQTGNLSGFILCKGMTSRAMGLSLNRSLVKLYRTVGRLPSAGGYTLWFGDSITAGQGTTSANKRFPTIVSQRAGTIEINFAQPSAKLVGYGALSGFSAVVPGQEKYQEAFFQDINTCVIMLGTNDANNDGTPASGGTPATLTTYQSVLNGVVDQFQKNGMRVIIAGIPWGNITSFNTHNAYIAKQMLVARNLKCRFVDLQYCFSDLANPASYFADTVHPNDLGNAVIADVLEAGINGQIYRLPTLDFPSIAANSSADLSIVMRGASVNMPVILGQPSTPTAGIVYEAFVSADDTVTIRAINTTASAIDPASQVIKVTVLL